MTARPLPLPPFFDPENARRIDYWPDGTQLHEVAVRWREAHHVEPAGRDHRRVHLLLVDMQKDFCLPQGSLYVAGRSGHGAIEDSQRIAAFIYRNLARITQITTTLDSHLAYQIFSPSFWVDAEGRHPAAHREVRLEAIERGALRPNPAIADWLCGGDREWLDRQVRHYCRSLESAGRFTLYLWPPHCIVGSEGHALVGVVHEARLFHAYARQSQSQVELKGSNPLTENYSVLSPEVLTRHDGGRIAERNSALIDALAADDAIIIAGQASSHCVRHTVADLLGEFAQRDPALVRKVFLLVDCMSPVTVPDGRGGFVVDFTDATEAALRGFAAAGVRLVKSTDPLEDWLDAGRAVRTRMK